MVWTADQTYLCVIHSFPDIRSLMAMCSVMTASSSAGSSSSSGPYTSMPDFSCALSLSRPDITTCAGAMLSSLSLAQHTEQPGMQHAARCAGACRLQQAKQCIHACLSALAPCHMLCEDIWCRPGQRLAIS